MSDSYKTAIFVIPTYRGGGAERVMLGIAARLHEMGHPVLVAGLLESGQIEADASVPSVGLGCRRVADAVLPLARLIRENQAKVVVSTLKHVSAMVAIVQALHRGRFRHIVRVANTYSAELSAIGTVGKLAWRSGLKACHRFAEWSICVSEGVRSDLVTNFGVDPRTCMVIPNPVDVVQINALAGKAGLPPQFGDANRKLLLSVGRLSAQKDFDCLLSAFELVLREIEPTCLLAIIGDGPERKRLEARIASHHLAGRVHLLGWIDNPYPIYDAADAFVLSSRFEGMPNVILEALAFGLPVVSTDCSSGPREILTDERLGRLVPVGDPPAMAQAIGLALGEQKSSFRREYVSRHFAPDAAARMYENAIFRV